VGLSPARIGELERGDGATAPLEAWVKLGKAIDRSLAVGFSREIDQPGPRDAGHLAGQELVLGLARRLGAAARVTSRKLAEVEGAAVAAAVLAARNGPPHRVAMCWLLVDTAANRRLVARYPEILEARFRGSSVGWVRCLADGAPPPRAGARLDRPSIAPDRAAPPAFPGRAGLVAAP
jgi:hypothetical protein